MREGTIAGCLILLAAGMLSAQDVRDFSGVWKLNPARSDLQNLPIPPQPFLRVDQNGTAMQLFASQQEGGPSVDLTYPLDGKQAKSRTGETVLNTMTKWEGDALLVNTLVSGSRDYTIMERWKRSRDGGTLTIRRTIASLGGERDAVLVYEKPGFMAQTAPAQSPALVAPARPTSAPPVAINTRERAPGFSGKTLDGERFSNETLKGKVVLLQFWATWCPYCRQDQRSVDSITQDLAHEGLVVLAIDVGESKRKVRQYLDGSPRSCKVALTEDTNLPAVFAAKAFPFYVVIDREGRIAATQRGSSGERGLYRMLNAAGL